MDGPPLPPDVPVPPVAPPADEGGARPGPGGAKTPSWQWFAVAIATVLVVAAVVIAATQLGGDGDEAGGADDTTAPVGTGTGDTSPAITTPGGTGAPTGTGSGSSPTLAPPEGAGDAQGVGHAFELAGGAVVRVDSVVPNAPEPEGVFAPPADVSITQLVVEACGGETRYSFGPGAWIGYLDTLQPAEAFLGSNNVVEIAPAPGGCVRFRLGYAVPDGRFLKNLVFAVGGDEVERWELTFGNAPAEPLTGTADPEFVNQGDTVELPNGASVVLRSVDLAPTAEDAASTPPDGSQFIVVDGQVCAGNVPFQIRPFSWFATTTDNQVGSNIFAPSTFPSTELAAGQCGWGTVHLLLPAETVPQYVLFTDAEGAELARWRLGA